MDLLGKDLESAILNIFTELKEMMSKELKESMRLISHQTESINKDRLLERPNGSLELKSTIIEMKSVPIGKFISANILK